MSRGKIACAPSEDSDQPAHPQSDQRRRCRLEDAFGHWLPIEYPAKTLITLRGCAGQSVSSLGAHAVL